MTQQETTALSTPYDSRSRRPKAASARWSTGFWSLVVTQFQGAFNDNALKFLIIYLIVDLGLAQRERDWLVFVVGGLFAVPFILFSMTGGYLADRFSKRSVTIGTKWMEVGAMTFSLVALARGSFAMETVGVFLLSSQAALFGPSKYGLMPEILPEKDLSWANGVIELGTFIASITATIASGFLAFYFRGHQAWSGVILLAFTFAGLAASQGITRVPAANPTRRFNWNPLGDLLEHVRVIRADPILRWAVVGNIYLWFLAALLQFTIVVYGHDILRIDERHISYLQAAVAIGIGLGAVVTGYLSASKIEYGLIPLGAVGMTIFGFLSAAHALSLERAGIYLGLLGFFGGFYAVPLNALIQHRPDPSRKGGVIAAANLLSFIGVFMAGAVYFLLAENLHLGADKIFFAGACMTLAATFYAVVLLPDSVLRLVLWALTRTLYRIHVDGRDNIPERGGALFLSGPLTVVDALLLSAATDRRIRFYFTGPSSGAPEPASRPSFAERVLRVATLPAPQHGNGNNGASDLRSLIAAAFSRDEVVCFAGEDVVGGAGQNRAQVNSSVVDLESSLNAKGCPTACPVLRVSVTGTGRGPLRYEASSLKWKKPTRIPCRIVVRFGSAICPLPAGDVAALRQSTPAARTT